MPEYAVMICSHGRAETMTTYDLLRERGYTGKIYVIVDDLDTQIGEYFQRFGKQVIIFNKEEYYEKTDTMDNFHALGTPVYARNFCFDFAAEKKLDYFCMMDDDITDFQIRYEKDGQLKGKKAFHMDELLGSMVEYMDEADITQIGWAFPGGLIGGLNGRFKTGLGITACCAVILKTNSGVRYVGTFNEDVNIAFKYWKEGHKFFEVYMLNVVSPERGTNDGGLADLYRKESFYRACFYSIILEPCSCKLRSDAKMTLSRGTVAPKIISERYKKYA